MGTASMARCTHAVERRTPSPQRFRALYRTADYPGPPTWSWPHRWWNTPRHHPVRARPWTGRTEQEIGLKITDILVRPPAANAKAWVW